MVEVDPDGRNWFTYTGQVSSGLCDRWTQSSSTGCAEPVVQRGRGHAGSPGDVGQGVTGGRGLPDQFSPLRVDRSQHLPQLDGFGRPGAVIDHGIGDLPADGSALLSGRAQRRELVDVAGAGAGAGHSRADDVQGEAGPNEQSAADSGPTE